MRNSDIRWRTLVGRFDVDTLTACASLTTASALAKDLAPEEKITGTVTGLRLRKHGAAVELEDGSVLECDDVVSALPNRTRLLTLRCHTR